MSGGRIAFKFLASKYAASLVALGIVRLASAKEMRKTEGIAGGRGDPNELRTTWHADGRFELKNDDPFIVALTGSPIPAACNMPKMVIQGGPGVFINMDADALLYCVSSELTTDLAARMKSEFNADACVKISDFDEFVRLLAVHPDVKAASWHVSQVTYVDSKQVKRFTGLNPSEKENPFSWQKEIRGILELRPPAKQSKLIAAPTVTHLLKREF
jgi:hypothetical protein